MSRKYKIRDQSQLYFVTFTVIHWIDVFTRDKYRSIFLDSIKYCQLNKGLEVYAWCIMTNHVHMILGTNDKKLEDIIRDLKSFTSRSIRKELEDRQNRYESRKMWMLKMMKDAGKSNNNNKDFQLWQQHFHPIELNYNFKTEQKLNYIHNNPVVAGFVESPEMWKYSSAKDYYGLGKGLIDVILIN
ncbi:transposase [Fulvivirgaceae bacterium BMA12]|uniref:Transposase n=1 Tax=Agaribacillus aureus TaxID=3051825 RepID=A0ABT8KYB4_9BACT|nr:transposase [Fulvivirgaceae bacterium BMA12]